MYSLVVSLSLRRAQGSASSEKGDGKRRSAPAPGVVFPEGTSFAARTPSRLLPSYLHVLPSPFEDPAVEQAYQAHFDRLKVRLSHRICSQTCPYASVKLGHHLI